MSKAREILDKFSEGMSDYDVVSDIIIDVSKKINHKKDWKKFKAEVIKRAAKQKIKTDGYEIADILDDDD